MSIRIAFPHPAACFAVVLMLTASACDKSRSSSQPVSAPAPAAVPAPASSAAVVGNAAAPVFDENFLKNEPKKYSQFREDVLIRFYFKDRRNGFFLDVGAAEWQLASTTYYLEHELDWKGIAIDARAELAKEWAEHRPGARFFAYMVTDQSGANETLYHAGRLSSGDKDHLKQFAGTEGAKPMEVQVPSITLNDLLAREKVDHIDYMNMDIEGFEPAALAGFDIDRYAPELVGIEAAPKTREAILKYFSDHGYRRIDEFLPYDPVNWYFEKKK